MFRKFFLVIFMSIPLLGAVITATPAPVLLAMGCLIVFGLAMDIRDGQQ